MKKKIRMISVMLTAVLMASVVVTPSAAARERGNDGGRERQRERQDNRQIQDLDAEVRVIDGRAALVLEVPERFGYGEEYLSVPLVLPQVIPVVADGQAIELEVRNNSVLVPTEDGMVAVSITDFCVVMIDGKMMLVAEEGGVVIRTEAMAMAMAGNPAPVVIPAIIVAIGRALGLGLAGIIALHVMWTAGVCLGPVCAAPTPDGSRGDRFCGHRRCPATRLSLLGRFGP